MTRDFDNSFARELCNVALYDLHSINADERRRAARARCAEIWNARAKEQS